MEYVPATRWRRGSRAARFPSRKRSRSPEDRGGARERARARHRPSDLKPANVAVTPEGDVKLLDFGLARAFAPDGEITSRTDDSPTISAVMTRGDVILGTAAYMSPEQARASWWIGGPTSGVRSRPVRDADRQQVFEGETTSDLLAAVLRQDVPWQRLPAATPPHVRALSSAA
jgi:hypothetical protein